MRYTKEVHKRNALLYIALKQRVDVEYSQPNGRNNKIKMDSYDVHVHPIQLQLYDKEYF